MNSATRWYCDVGGVESAGETVKITSKREISSSHFLINFLCVREMRAIVKQEAVDHVKKEAEIEWFWSKCMKLLLKTFNVLERIQIYHAKIAAAYFFITGCLVLMTTLLLYSIYP